MRGNCQSPPIGWPGATASLKTISRCWRPHRQTACAFCPCSGSNSRRRTGSSGDRMPLAREADRMRRGSLTGEYRVCLWTATPEPIVQKGWLMEQIKARVPRAAPKDSARGWRMSGMHGSGPFRPGMGCGSAQRWGATYLWRGARRLGPRRTGAKRVTRARVQRSRRAGPKAPASTPPGARGMLAGFGRPGSPAGGRHRDGGEDPRPNQTAAG